MKYADMHCDTLTELYLGNHKIADAPLHIALNRAYGISRYTQIAAVWTDKDLTDNEGYDRFFKVVQSFCDDPSTADGKICLCNSAAEFEQAELDGAPAFILAVEGARLLCGDITRLRVLYNAGVRLITLQWSGSDCIGGAWDTDEPLTDFGRLLLHKMAQLHIGADISHASDKTALEITEIAAEKGMPVCASHSNSRAICNHGRNLTDELFIRISELCGVVGLSMAPEHLTTASFAGISDICRHLYHYLELGGENTVCFGCDFDGISSTPRGVSGISDIHRLYDTMLTEGFTEPVLNKLFYGNARRFIAGLLD